MFVNANLKSMRDSAGNQTRVLCCNTANIILDWIFLIHSKILMM